MGIVSRPQFDYWMRERKNGQKYIKVMMYIYDADGYVEVARIHEGTSHWVRNGYGEIEDLYEELKENAKVTEVVARTKPSILSK